MAIPCPVIAHPLKAGVAIRFLAVTPKGNKKGAPRPKNPRLAQLRHVFPLGTHDNVCFPQAEKSQGFCRPADCNSSGGSKTRRKIYERNEKKTMVSKTQARRQRDIKSKLMAAIAMLLVSSIMMVSSTYAWFTLSTAPEVTGITTAVGANGNLEMALLPETGLLTDITSAAGDSVLADDRRNVTWGNLVDLSNSTFYGMNDIILYPSALNVATWEETGDDKYNPASLAEALLKTPSYGADGRVAELLANTVTSTYDSTADSFPQNNEYGVRAVGAASGMTDRQLAYRNYRSAASTAMAQAKVYASQSLNTNGASLANIAMAHAVDANATHTQEDVASLKAIVNDLLGTTEKTGVLQYIEEAYINYIIALGASQKSVEANIDDTKYKAFQSAVTSATDADEDGMKIDDVVALLSTHSVTLPEVIGGAIEELIKTRGTVATALEELNNLTGETITWAQISTPLNKLAVTEAMEVNDIPVSDIKDNMSELVSSVTSGGGLTVTMSTGGGVYADIADHCGNYNANITIENVSYGGITLDSMPARMQTNTSVNPVYLEAFGLAVNAAEAPVNDTENGAGQVMPISEMYGYIIDLAFRTNAAESNLLLQQNGVDRIYSTNQNGVEQTVGEGENKQTDTTMGNGATMSFTSTEASFTEAQVKELMKAIRIIFFDPDTRGVVATAKLDVANATTVGTEVTAKIYIYTISGGSSYVPVSEGATHKEVTTTTYEEATAEQKADANITLYADNQGTKTVSRTDETYNAESVYYVKVTNTTYEPVTAGATDGTHKLVNAGAEVPSTDNVIMPLNQNVATKLSVLVYLDGNNIENKDVAYSGGTSVTGTMNLQFASSANLVPMEYASLMEQTGTTTATTYTVTIDGTAQATGATANTAYTYTLTNSAEVTSVSVGGTTLTGGTDYTVADGVLTIPAEKVTGNIVINTSVTGTP